MALIDVIVSDIVSETCSVKTLYLARADGTPIGKYTPGAHIDVVGPTAITRQYSLCSTPDSEETFAVAVKREENSRGGSVALHELRPGDRLQISEPRNLLHIAENARHHVLIAAGIGITPMLSMARYMDVHDIGFELHYFARSVEEAPFLPMLQEKCPEKLHAYLGIRRDLQESVLDAALSTARNDTHVYTCGPAGFMDKVLALAENYVPLDNVHFENFHAVERGEADGPEVAFDVDSQFRLLSSTAATVRYENLVGDRYLELLEGPGGVDELPGGGTIPVEQTTPALDLDLLLGGFKPLLRGLDPKQVNDLSAALLHVLQGQGGTLVSLLGSTGSFTNTLADRDQLIGDVIGNLNTMLGTIDDQGREFETTIDSLQQLISGLAEDRDPIGDAIPRLDAATGDLAGLLQATRPDIQSMIAEAGRTATQLDLGKDNIDTVLTRLPGDYKKLIRVGSYGSFFQFYLCSNTFKISGPDGRTLLVPTAKQDTGRCASINGEN